jgi:hypothetical protein
LIGILCAVFRIVRSAYRYASITLTIVMLIPRPTSPWVVALHRFLEVSMGIAVALAVTALWPEKKLDTLGRRLGSRSKGEGLKSQAFTGDLPSWITEGLSRAKRAISSFRMKTTP